ncbi:MAG: hypothetical protein LBF27_29565 [Sphingobacterium sp.]|nr:hypothetical protein [Sphingobacterium sp.]
MKWMFCITLFCVIGNSVTFAQMSLKNGVYEFTDIISSDSVRRNSGQSLIIEKKTISRTLIVADDKISYEIRENTKAPSATRGVAADYKLQLKRVNNQSFRAKKGKSIKLNIVIVDGDSVEVAVLAGQAEYCYSGGMYFRKIITLSPERKTLTFKRGLLPEDIAKL